MNTIPDTVRRSIPAVGVSAFGSAWSADEWYWAPGRIELIGNHVDYNGGPVLAAAIDRGIYIAGDRSGSESSAQVVFPDMGDVAVQAAAVPALADWQSTALSPRPVDYLCGAVSVLTRRGYRVHPGSRLVLSGNLPHGIGISSSAALCVGLVLSLIADQIDPHEVVLAAQEAEHRAGSPCGTMDQSASVFGGLIRFDGSGGDVATVVAELGDHTLLVVNSGVVRSLATSAYPERVTETNRALSALRGEWKRDLRSLAEITLDEVDGALQALKQIGQPTWAARVRHVVTECDRVVRAEAAVRAADWDQVGELMTESGRSSAGDYDISHPLVEELVALCLSSGGVLGARMMGGGQGGSVLVLARKDAIAELEARLDRDYYGTRQPAIPVLKYLPCTFAPGAGRVSAS
jgi:galactokinase